MDIREHGIGTGRKVDYGTATGGQVLQGYTIGSKDGLVSGTIPNKALEPVDSSHDGTGDPINIGRSEASSVWTGTQSLFFRPKIGFYDGDDTWVYAKDPNFKPENILNSVSIFGLTGGIPDLRRENLAQWGGYTGCQSIKGDGGGSIVVEPYTGYYEKGLNANGFGTIIATDPNYIPDNILSGKSIFGVQGTLQGITSLVAGDTVVADTNNVDILVNTANGYAQNTYVKVKELRMDMAGTVRVRLGLVNVNNTSYAKLYKNGVAISNEMSNYTGSEYFIVQDVVVNKGDLLQFYVRHLGGAIARTFQVSIGNSGKFVTKTL